MTAISSRQSPHFWEITLVGLTAIVLYGLYNIFLHPLRKYKGPLLWRAYRLPYAIKAWQGTLPKDVLGFHQKYGSVIRIAPDELAFTEAAAWDDINGLGPDRRQNQKEILSFNPPQPGYRNSMLWADDTTHARFRRIYGRAFSPEAVEQQAGMLLKYSDLLVQRLKEALAKSSDGVVDMSRWWNYATFDLTGELAFDESFHCLDQGGKEHFFVGTVCNYAVGGFRLAQLERYKIWSLLQPLIPKSFMQPLIDMDDYTSSLVDRCLARGYVPGKPDFFNFVLQNKSGNDSLTREELIANGKQLIVAGSETTATLMSGATWLLCKHPEAYKRTVEEVRERFKRDEDITIKTVNDLNYMIAVLSESLRYFPPAPGALARIIANEGGQNIAGHHVPIGTRVSVVHWTAYHSEKNFKRPDEFIPERWLSDTPVEFANDARDVVQPFGSGPRVCLGKNLAYAEMRLLLAKVLWHFDFELASPNDDWMNDLKMYVIWDRMALPLNVRLKPVER